MEESTDASLQWKSHRPTRIYRGIVLRICELVARVFVLYFSVPDE